MQKLICLIISISCVPALADADSIEDRIAEQIIRQTNDFRKSKGLEPVERNATLTTCAEEFAAFMAESEKYGHRADGRTPAERAEAAGYDYCVVRENIAYRTNTGEVTDESLTEVFVSGWIDSPPHRENMLADYATETGVGIATSDGITYYAVQLFSRPKSASFQIEITNDSESVETLIIRGGDEKNTVEIRPRMILKMTRCFPSMLFLEGSGSKIEVQASVKLLIEDGKLLRTDQPLANEERS